MKQTPEKLGPLEDLRGAVEEFQELSGCVSELSRLLQDFLVAQPRRGQASGGAVTGVVYGCRAGR